MMYKLCTVGAMYTNETTTVRLGDPQSGPHASIRAY